MNTQITKSFETWHCTDPRLPAKTTRPVGNRSLDTLVVEVSEGVWEDGLQLQPIGLIRVKKEYTFVWGNGRLQRIRDFYEENKHSGNIDVLILEGVDPKDRSTLALIENASRSENRLNDFYKMEELRKVNKMISYHEIYNLTGLPVGTQKKLDKDYGKLPLWVKNALLRGDITETVAIGVARAGTDTQQKLKEKFQEERVLTARDVKEERQAVQQSVYASMAPALFAVAAHRDWFSYEELVSLADCLQGESRTILLEYLNKPV